jgi:hypothetical protein
MYCMVLNNSLIFVSPTNEFEEQKRTMKVNKKIANKLVTVSTFLVVQILSPNK